MSNITRIILGTGLLCLCAACAPAPIPEPTPEPVVTVPSKPIPAPAAGPTPQPPRGVPTPSTSTDAQYLLSKADEYEGYGALFSRTADESTRLAAMAPDRQLRILRSGSLLSPGLVARVRSACRIIRIDSRDPRWGGMHGTVGLLKNCDDMIRGLDLVDSFR